jgi:magnesium transporter
MGRNESKLINKSTLPYIKDIYDHVIQLIDSVETFRDISATMLDIYLSSLSNKMNQVMKRLTLLNCIFMPLTVVAGIGGMSEWSMMTGSNNWPVAYPLFVLGLGIIGFITYKIFKWKGWT